MTSSNSDKRSTDTTNSVENRAGTGEDEARWVDAIRAGDEGSWQQLIDRYEGRLLAFVRRRLSDTSAAEDIVQETFIGFLVSLPNYDTSRPLESYLFSICGYKLTDFLRRSGRRPTLSMTGRSEDSRSAMADPAGPARVASSIMRSAERQRLEEQVVAEAIAEQVQRWRSSGNAVKLQALELLFVVGRSNREVAETLAISQQQVANLKSDFLIRLKAIIARRDLDPAVFPELAETDEG